MVKTRVILFLVGLGLAFGQYALVQSSPNEVLAVVLHVLGSILLLAAMGIFTLSFIEVGVSPQGELCFNPNNPFWKLMKFVYEGVWKDRNSLCKSYWLFAFILLFGAFILGVIGVVLYGIVTELIPNTVTVIQEEGILAVVKPVAIGIGVIVAFFGIIVLFVNLALKHLWLKRLLQVLGWIILVTVLFLAFVFGPIHSIQDNQDVTTSEAIPIYLKWVGITLGSIAAAVLLIWAAFKYLPMLRNTWLGQIILAIKRNLCPSLVACPIAGKQQVQV